MLAHGSIALTLYLNLFPGQTAGVNLSVAVQQTIEAYSSVNRFLTAFIDHSLRDDDYAVRNKLLFERILDLELGELPQDKAVFYNDDSRSFTNVFFFGHEWTLLLWELLFFTIVDYAALDFVLAGVLTYLQSRILKSVREILGKKNLAKKTLVDERFLI
jgi:meckelin